MGIPDGAHTHGSGGSGLGTAALVLLGAVLVVKLAGPAVAAVAELVRVLVIAAGVVVGAGAAGLACMLVWRRRRPAARAVPAHVQARAARALPEPRAAQALPEPQRRAVEQRGEVHLHITLTAEELQALLSNPGALPACLTTTETEE